MVRLNNGAGQQSKPSQSYVPLAAVGGVTECRRWSTHAFLRYGRNGFHRFALLSCSPPTMALTERDVGNLVSLAGS